MCSTGKKGWARFFTWCTTFAISTSPEEWKISRSCRNFDRFAMVDWVCNGFGSVGWSVLRHLGVYVWKLCEYLKFGTLDSKRQGVFEGFTLDRFCWCMFELKKVTVC